jgi:hypothetical protein
MKEKIAANVTGAHRRRLEVARDCRFGKGVAVVRLHPPHFPFNAAKLKLNQRARTYREFDSCSIYYRETRDLAEKV